jgi:CelD/BcsL family acetyltransferase involved in cellulose biosynthesis
VSTVMESSTLLPTCNGGETERQIASDAMSIARVEVYRDPAAALQSWAELEALAPASAYQTRRFTIPWLETIGAARGIEPLFILGKDREGRATALLSLGLKRLGPFRIACFLGGKEANFNLGLFRPDLALTLADLRFLLKSAVKALGRDRPNLFLLQNQPFDWDGTANPLALLPHQPSPSFAYATQLGDRGEAFLATKLSKDARKKFRKKEARLAEMGPVDLISNATPAAARAIVDAFLAEKITRCEARSIETDFSDPAMRAFLERLSLPQDGQPPWLTFQGLKAGDRIVATYAGAEHRGRFSCLINSFDSDPDVAKTSPGDLLLMRLIAQQCDRGLRSFDLGIGEARYKSSYCNETVPLFDLILPIGIRGHLCAAYARTRLKIKRHIKQNPKMLSRIQRLRRILPGLAVL